MAAQNYLFLLTLSLAVSFSSAVQILGGDPLSSEASHFNPIDHPKPPSSLWGTVEGPYPTNNWWGNVILDNGDQTINILPFLAKVLDDGLHICLPGKNVGQSQIRSTYSDTWIFGAQEGLGTRVVSKGDLLSVTVQWVGGIDAPLVRGMPYVTLNYLAVTPVLTTDRTVLGINGVTGSSVTDDRFEIELDNGQTWIIYASELLTLDVSGGVITANAPLFGTIRAAVVDSATLDGANLLDSYRNRIPIGGVVEATSSGDTANMTFTWETTGTGQLLMLALPHHMDIISGVQGTSLTYNVLKGDMTGVVGEVWTLTEPLTTISWYSPNGIAPNRLDDVIAALNAESNLNVPAGDPYFAGKEMARLARLAVIAEEVGETALATTFLDAVKPVLESWLNGTNADALLYDQSWGGVVSTNGIADSAADFGMGYYNDHHFHYGYHIYTAAVLAKTDPSWGVQYNEKVLQLIRDIAEPSGKDPYYTQTRMKDAFAGHSWANGIGYAFDESRNQESTSESVHGWYAVFLYGLATGNERIKDLGRLLTATEIRSSQKYWQITSDDTIYPAPFSDNKVVGILWSTLVDYNTWFGSNIEFIHCIQMLPFTPITEELLPSAWITEEYPVLEPAFFTADEAWRGYIIMAHAIIDKDAAWNESLALTSYDDGNSQTNIRYWIATRP